MINKKSKIFIAGHNGMVGNAILKKFKKFKFKNILTIDRYKLDLNDQTKVFKYLKRKKPKLVIMAAAKVGGILANDLNKSQFIYDNLQIQNNLIHGSYIAGVKNLIFLGSSCIYPKNSKQPIKESSMLGGYLEQTNDAYAIAKIAGIMMCNNYSKNYNLNYFSLMPSNMYGPNDNYDLNSSHFFPALIKKVYYAVKNKKKSFKVWGSGKPYRELLFVEDFADAVIYFMNKKIKEPYINIGTGKDYRISWYAKFIANELGAGNLKIIFDKTKPDGMRRKLLDVSKSYKYGWKARTSLKKGFEKTFNDFLLKNL